MTVSGVLYGFSVLFRLITEKTNEANTNKHAIAAQGYIFEKIAAFFPKKREEIPNTIIITLPIFLIAGVIVLSF